MRNKRGQFFLVAAIIIVVAIIGFATTVNSVRVTNEKEAFSDLADEIRDETKEVLNYGIYNSEDINSLVKGFLENYTNYISQEEVLFIYGNRDNIDGLIFREQGGEVGIDVGTIPGVIEIQYTTGDEANVTQSPDGKMVFVDIEGIVYEFNLKEGQNFFVLLRQEENGERYVATRE